MSRPVPRSRHSIISSFTLIFGFTVVCLLTYQSHHEPVELGNTTWTDVHAKEGSTRFERLNRTIIHINQHYLKRDALDPKAVLDTVLAELSRAVPSLVIHDTDPAEDIVRLSLDQRAISLETKKLTNIWQLAFLLSDVLSVITDTSLLSASELERIEIVVCRAMLNSLDQYSTLLTPAQMFEIKQNTEGLFGGIGIVIEQNGNGVRIREVMNNSPASEAGIKPDDLLTEIGDDTTENLTLDDAAELLRGPVGSRVSLTIKRDDSPRTRTLILTRRHLKVQSVEKQPSVSSVAHILIKHFQENSHRELANIMSRLDGRTKTIVLDLRGNPGGILEEAVAVANLFLKSGVILTTVSPERSMNRAYSATEDAIDTTRPMIVLVDQESASASEIVAAALQDNHRALIMGENTFGKGSVQMLFEFPDESGLKLTTAEYLTPMGVSIHDIGVTPDIVVNRVKPLQMKVVSGQRHHQRSLAHTSPQHLYVANSEFDNTLLVKLAEHLALAPQHIGRPDTQRTVRKKVDLLNDDYQKRIIDDFDSKGLVWQPNACAGQGKVDISVVPNEDPKSIDGWRPELKLTNRSQKDSGALKLHVQSGTYESSVDIGGLRPNEERLFKLPNSVAVNRKAHRCLVSFEIKNGCGHIQGALDHLMNCVHQPSPQIASRIVFSDKTEGNHDGVLQFGEHAELNTTIRVSHINAPLELDVAVQLDGPTHERFIRLHEGHFRTTVGRSDLSSNKASNTVQERNFSFKIEGKISKGQRHSMTQAARLIVTERRLGVLLEQSIELVVHPAEPRGVLGLSRVSVERSGLRAVVKNMPVLFQPSPKTFQVAEITGAVRIIDERGTWSLIEMPTGFGWVSNLSAKQTTLISKSKEPAMLTHRFTEPPRLTFERIDESVMSSTLALTGQILGAEVQNLSLFHNGKKRLYTEFPQNGDTNQHFYHRLSLRPGTNRFLVRVTTRTGHKNTEWMTVTLMEKSH